MIHIDQVRFCPYCLLGDNPICVYWSSSPEEGAVPYRAYHQVQYNNYVKEEPCVDKDRFRYKTQDASNT